MSNLIFTCSFLHKSFFFEQRVNIFRKFMCAVTFKLILPYVIVQISIPVITVKKLQVILKIRFVLTLKTTKECSIKYFFPNWKFFPNSECSIIHGTIGLVSFQKISSRLHEHLSGSPQDSCKTLTNINKLLALSYNILIKIHGEK